MIGKIIRKYFFKQAKPRFDSEAGIIDFKSNAWKSRKMADAYHKEVEHVFFDNVTAKIFIDNIESNSHVLDVGAGTGRLSLLLADNGCRVLACDISREMLSYIDKNKDKRNIETMEAAATAIPVQDE